MSVPVGDTAASQVAGLSQEGGRHLGCPWHWVLVVTDSGGGCTHRMCVCIGVYTELTQDACIHTEPSRAYMYMSVHTGMNSGLYLRALGRYIPVDTRVCGPSQAYTCKYIQLIEVYYARAANPSECVQCACVQRAHREPLFSELAGNLGMLPSLLIFVPGATIRSPTACLPPLRGTLGILPFHWDHSTKELP